MAWAQEGVSTGQLTAGQLDELVETVMAKTGAKGNGFKVVNGELVYRAAAPAALVEGTNVLYPGKERRPGHPGDKVQKGLKSYFIEHVEIANDYIPLGRSEPDIVGEQRIKHVTGPRGRQSTINVVDRVLDEKLTLLVKVLDNCIVPQLWQDKPRLAWSTPHPATPDSPRHHETRLVRPFLARPVPDLPAQPCTRLSPPDLPCRGPTAPSPASPALTRLATPAMQFPRQPATYCRNRDRAEAS